MEKGQIVQIKIEDMSSEGQGIGKAEGFVIFVPGAVLGDIVKVQLTKVKKNYGFGRLVEMVAESPYRTDGFDCEFFEKGCGGCRYGRLEYSAQLKMKENQVREKLSRLAGIEAPVVRQIIGMEEGDNEGSGSFRYRNKAQFPVSTGGIITRKGGIVENLGEPAVGFFRSKSHEVVDCGDCYLQSMAAMAAADALRRFMEEDNITAWDPKWQKGLIRHLIVKTGFESGEVMVILVINGNGIPNIQKLVEMMDDAIYEVGYSLESVVLNIKKAENLSGKNSRKHQNDGGRIMGDKNIVAAGKPVINDSVGGLSFEISPASFYQVNPLQMRRLYDKVREYCSFYQGEHEKPVILDLYCGVGTIGLYCADMAEFIVGIEVVREAVIDANRNAVINGIVNARYICGKAEEVLPAYMAYSGNREGAADEDTNRQSEEYGMTIDPQLASRISDADIAILDPPRAGCRPELLEAVSAAGVESIVYVSCDPATLARDIGILGSLGYEFIEAAPVDMFPWTTEVEVVSLLSRKKPTV